MFQGNEVNEQEVPVEGSEPAMATTKVECGKDADSASNCGGNTVTSQGEVMSEANEFVDEVDGEIENNVEGVDFVSEVDELDAATKSQWDEISELDPLDDEPMSEFDVLTLEEVALYLKVEYSAVRKLIKDDGLPGRKIGSEWRFARGAIAKWLNAPGGEAPVKKSKSERAEREPRAERTERAERPSREDRPRREERAGREDFRPRKRFAQESGEYSPPPRPKPQFRSQEQFGGGSYDAGQQGGPGSYPPPRRRRYEEEPQQEFGQSEFRPGRKRPFREQQGGGFGGGQQFGSGQGDGGGQQFGGPRKPKRQALSSQRFKRLDRRRFSGDDEGAQDE